ncbi:Uma2 family endonuclease [Limnoraphis robusta]|uniref:Uma2 family endonuclease n=1 Tax=Limnoraphis robusta CCNP1315 TaxID=3110306 RepID=A0ABU5U512_9CYAN|nr:Uma2 family endonuclease [Limnoraphis robusta]MEA5522256.1 Uma2 family endonuclease [Limnoraphis robusta CCNP1315]MEA5546625.1 Uma2 family endonuclease [Limnoraphis robusta CCNP1324]
MTQTITKPISFDEFVAWYPENATCNYELHNGRIVEMPLGTGAHSNITGFITGEIHFEIRRRQLPYSIPGDCLLKPLDLVSGYQPDVIVLDKGELSKELRWQKESIISLGSSVRLVVEVVSTNWQNDYLRKAGDYELMGIPEYWIVDYLGLGGRRFIGEPKSPTLSVYTMVDGEYEVMQFRGDDRVESLAFPELELTVKQIFDN